MTKYLCAVLLLSPLSVLACGDDNDNAGSSDPVALCKDLAKTLCSKFYGCFSDAELEAAAAIVGNNEGDCVTKWTQELDCTTEGVKCDSGETFNASKANECLSQYKAFSCNEIEGFATGATMEPAACEQSCE